MSKWIPDRKVWAGGVTMIIVWLIVRALNIYAGVDIPIENTAGLASAFGKAVEYLVPQPAKDLIAKIDDEMVAAAGRSPDSEVSTTVGRAGGNRRGGDGGGRRPRKGGNKRMRRDFGADQRRLLTWPAANIE